MKKTIILFVKALVSVFCIVLLSMSIDWPEMLHTLSHIKIAWVLLALAIFWIAQVISALRCAYVARVLGKNLDLATSTHAHFVGLWFNQVLPTSLGGDVIKIAILNKVLGLGLAIRSAILDRVSGLVFLMATIVLTLPFYTRVITHTELLSGLALLSIGFMLALIMAVILSGYITRMLSGFSWMNMPVQLLKDISALARGKALWQQTWTSAIVHFNGIAAYALLGLALGVHVEPLLFVLMVPLVFLIALMPVSLAGWGVREMGAVWLFGLAGVDKESALAISVSFGFLLIISGFPGLLLFLLDKRNS